VENAATAAVALVRLGIADSAIEPASRATRWPGRLERVPSIPRSSSMAPTIPPAPARWRPTSTASTPAAAVRLIYGAMRDKAIDEISGILFPRAASR
jgi:dihydrofolate synthase/folylpolyglutamate synthase